MEKVKKVTLSGMLFAIGLILPLFIGQIPAVGKMLLPMHITGSWQAVCMVTQSGSARKHCTVLLSEL